MDYDIEKHMARIHAICQAKNWKKDWLHGGCYLHLESSEFIEALRGKGNSNPAEEAGDVLNALLSTLAYHKIPFSEVAKKIDAKLEKLEIECHLKPQKETNPDPWLLSERNSTWNSP